MERVSSGGHSRALETLVPPDMGKITVTTGFTEEKPATSPCDYFVLSWLYVFNKYTNIHNTV